MSEVGELSAVTLPRGLEPGDVAAVVDQLEARADAVALPKGRKRAGTRLELPEGVTPLDALPPQIEASRVRLIQKRDALREASRAPRAPAADAATDDDKTTANARADEAWRAMESWLLGWSRLEDGQAPGAAEAGALHAEVFPAKVGLRFIGWRPRKQWDAMLSRMAALERPASEALFASLGGARFLAWLQATHREFGRAYGFTRAVAASAPAASTDSRPQWLAAQDALRDYVRKVSSYADPDVPGSEALAAWLLEPFTDMVAEFAARPPKKKPAPPPGDEKPR